MSGLVAGILVAMLLEMLVIVWQLIRIADGLERRNKK